MSSLPPVRVDCSKPYKVRFVGLGEVMAALEGLFGVLVDENVLEFWPQLFASPRVIHVVPSGEQSKSVEQLERCARALAAAGCQRSGRIGIVGGGVTGDLGGFVASTYMRGIASVQVPTTLLAMVDSSVGGKTALDLPEGKNLIGSFNQPAEVLVCVDFLRTLPPAHLRNGLAEVIKMGYVVDPRILTLFREAAPTEEVIRGCVEAKASVVAEDEFDATGRRAVLNFGHTIGHAIEAQSDFEILHGEAISIGMLLEAELGELLGVTEPGLSTAVKGDLNAAGLPTALPFGMCADNLLGWMASDKKSDAAGLGFSLVTRPGECKLFPGVPASKVRAVVDEVAQSSS